MTKIDKLIATYNGLASLLLEANDKALKDIGKSFRESMTKLEDGISSGSVKGAQAVVGLEQGLNELPFILEDGDPDLVKAAYGIIEGNYRDYFKKQIKKVKKIQDAGMIRNEPEFYLVRITVDILEREGAAESDLEAMMRLLDKYEV